MMINGTAVREHTHSSEQSQTTSSNRFIRHFMSQYILWGLEKKGAWTHWCLWKCGWLAESSLLFSLSDLQQRWEVGGSSAAGNCQSYCRRLGCEVLLESWDGVYCVMNELELSVSASLHLRASGGESPTYTNTTRSQPPLMRTKESGHFCCITLRQIQGTLMSLNKTSCCTVLGALCLQIFSKRSKVSNSNVKRRKEAFAMMNVLTVGNFKHL